MEDRIQYSSAAYTKTDVSLSTIASLSPNEIRRDPIPSSPPPKRPTLVSGLKDWSKKGGTAVRVAKKSSGLNLSQFYPKTKAESSITKTDTSQIIVKILFCSLPQTSQILS
nr:unnamed protein product [Callosobruchus chinensis]